ncbi:MAG: response regulator [Phycisphaerae bacterium]|nr:response regulator [Phycisphaerae bacterium]
MGQKTILLIDDDADFVEATRAVLEGAGYAIAAASSGKEGLARLAKGGVDCVLLDVMMTRETEGFHTAEQIRENPATANLPILMLTGIVEKTGFEFSPETDADYLPVDAFIRKPVDPDDLLQAVAEALEK